ncbi:FHA domain-containing protein [Microbacterium sp.]|uniref:FHA domain-containing protein n=1 Tax=Microbacterium sp. TaxID=51671 RepID=UPI003A90AA7B
MRAGYELGSWWSLIGRSGVVVLPPDADDELVDGLWDVIESAAGMSAIVDRLTSHVGGVFAEIPPFAAVVREGADVRVTVRGRVSVRITDADGDERTFTGAEVTTWSEHFVPRGTEAEVLVDEAVSGRVLPVAHGVVLAARVALDFTREGAAVAALPDAGSAPLADAEPASDAESAPLADAEPAPLADAAEPAEPGSEPQPEVAEPETPPAPAQKPVTEPTPVVEPELGSDGASESDGTPEPDGTSELDDAPEPEATPAIEEPEPAASVDGSAGLDEDIEATVVSAATLAPDAPSAPPVAPLSGDHDGETILFAQMREMRQAAAPAPAGPDEPTAALPVQTPPTRGRVIVSTGQTIDLDRPVIIGRRPRSTRASGDSVPHLVAVDSPQQDISRNHLEIRPEAGACVVIDLHTTNGSTLLRPGADPVRLHPGEQTVVVNGDIVDLGDGVTVRFEDLP